MPLKIRFLLSFVFFTALMLPLQAFKMPCRVYPVGRPVVLRIYPSNSYDLVRMKSLEIYGVRSDGSGFSGKKLSGVTQWERLDFTEKDGVIEIKTVMHREALHSLLLQLRTAKGKVQRVKVIETYALEDDLFRKEMLMGDLHAHSRNSTGRQEPDRLAALALRAGYRFIAITDRDPEAVRKLAADPAWKKCGFILIPGEELSIASRQVVVSALNTKIGIRQFGKGSAKLAAEKYLAFIKEKGLDERYQRIAATAMYLNDIIHREGGFAVMCHPFRTHHGRFDTPPELRDFLLKYGSYDAYEVINSTAGLEGLVLGTATAVRLMRSGAAAPVPVATQNSKNTAELNFGRHHIMIFTAGNTPGDVFKALREGSSIAVSGVRGNLVMLGSERLVSYANFLRKNHFSRHYTLSYRLGNALLHKINGNPRAEKLLSMAAAEYSDYLRDFKYRETPSGQPQLPGGGSGKAQQQQK